MYNIYRYKYNMHTCTQYASNDICKKFRRPYVQQYWYTAMSIIKYGSIDYIDGHSKFLPSMCASS